MKHKLRFLVTAVGIGSLAVAAQAVTISGVSGHLEDGSVMGPLPPGSVGSAEGYTFIPGPSAGPGASGVEFSTAQNTWAGDPSGAYTESVDFAYTVTADAGMRIVGYQVTPGMYLYGASGTINLHHGVVSDLNNFSSAETGNGLSVADWTKPIGPATSLSVSGLYSVTLDPSATASADALHLNVTYFEQPVPEPSAMAVLAIGGIGLFLRRRSK